MAAFQRFMTWISGERVEEMERALFESLPMELYGEIFKHLDVQNLKTCKHVCRTWNMGLSASRLLLKKSLTSWHGRDFLNVIIVRITRIFGRAVNWTVVIPFSISRMQIDTDEFRFVNPGDFFIEHLGSYFISLDVFQFITHLEILKSYISLSNLSTAVSQLKALTSLTLIDVQLSDTEANIERLIRVLPNSHWLNLKMLTIQNKSTWYYRASGILGNFCTNLENMTVHQLSLSDIFYDNIIQRDVPDERFMDFSRIMRNNSRTLKSVALNTFILNFGRDDSTLRTQPLQQQVRDGQDELFIRFMIQLNEFTDWGLSGLHLIKLNLSFQLVCLELPQARQVFFQFLRTQTDLKEFSLSHVHFPGGGQGTIRALLECLPANCRTKLEGVMAVRMLNPIPNDEEPYLETPIQGNFDSIVELQKANLSLTLRFVCCNSLDDVNFFARNIESLTKIKIQQPGARSQHKVTLEDADIQRIIATSIHLTDLFLEFCNMGAITDFGLTGIHAEACLRMSLARDFALQDEDLIGSPISAIRDLRSLNLSTVGGNVTDVTAYHAFKGLNSLTTFGIYKPQISSRGYRELRRLFQFNQVVQLDPYTRHQFDSLDSECN